MEHLAIAIQHSKVHQNQCKLCNPAENGVLII